MSQEQLVRKLISDGVIRSQEVIRILSRVDRGVFFNGSKAYEDKPQRIGFQATISAPHMHGYALEYLKDHLTLNSHVLDVGSGSGYLTACMAQMLNFTGKTVGIEHIPQLVQQSVESFERFAPGKLGDSVEIVQGDGRLGLSRFAPYKVIHVGACVERIPECLVDQLDFGGRLMVPVGKYGKTQVITLVDKDFEGRVSSQTTFNVVYVPLCDMEKQING